LQKINSLVEFETNKYIHGTYHHRKFQEKFNLDKFISLAKASHFKEHEEYNQISNFFQPSVEIIAKEILDELNENGLKRKEPRLKLFLDDLKDVMQTLDDFDLTDLEYFYKSARKNIMSSSNLKFAIADIMNLLQKYQILEKKIIENIIYSLSSLVSKNYIYVLGQFRYDDDGTIHKRNLKEDRIDQYLKLLYIILMSKNITKEEITKLFEKLSSIKSDYVYFCDNFPKTYFKSDYPLDLANTFGSLSEYRYEIMKRVDILSIKDRFKRFIELFYEEKECFYVFKILNTEISEVNEVQYGGITYYNEKILKSKGYKNSPDLDEYGKDHFEGKKEVKAIISYKSKRYFSNISALKVRNIIENNISFLKLTNPYPNDMAQYFKLCPSKMDVSYSYKVLDNDYFMIDGASTAHDGDRTFRKNIIYKGIFTNNDIDTKLDLLMQNLNYKQAKDCLTTNDHLILQSMQKYKQAIESTNFTDLLLLSWNGLEFLSKAIDNKNEIDTIQSFASLVYRFIYTNKSSKEINYHSKHLVIYAYTYRNKIVHSYLIEDSLMISVSKGINIIFEKILILIIGKIVFSLDFNLEDIVSQLKSDLNKNTEKMKNENNGNTNNGDKLNRNH